MSDVVRAPRRKASAEQHTTLRYRVLPRASQILDICCAGLPAVMAADGVLSRAWAVETLRREAHAAVWADHAPAGCYAGLLTPLSGRVRRCDATHACVSCHLHRTMRLAEQVADLRRRGLATAIQVDSWTCTAAELHDRAAAIWSTVRPTRPTWLRPTCGRAWNWLLLAPAGDDMVRIRRVTVGSHGSAIDSPRRKKQTPEWATAHDSQTIRLRSDAPLLHALALAPELLSASWFPSALAAFRHPVGRTRPRRVYESYRTTRPGTRQPDELPARRPGTARRRDKKIKRKAAARDQQRLAILRAAIEDQRPLIPLQAAARELFDLPPITDLQVELHVIDELRIPYAEPSSASRLLPPGESLPVPEDTFDIRAARIRRAITAAIEQLQRAAADGREPADALADEQLRASPLTRVMLARQISRPEIAAAYHDTAAEQYTLAPAEYAAAWGSEVSSLVTGGVRGDDAIPAADEAAQMEVVDASG